jgi:DNA-binding NarL/FixJ family response regulator
MKVLVIDDHALIREALRGVLKELRGEASVLEASDWKQANRQIESTPGLDLILLDLGLPDRDGLEVLADLRERYPTVSIVVLSGRHDRESVARALELGAQGFIPKSASREVMLSAFNLIFSGGMYIPPEILAIPGPASMRNTAEPGLSVKPGSSAKLGLTDRQLEVLTLLMQGKSNKAICRALDLAEPTVKNHVTAVLRALNATNRTEAVIAARALGFDPQRSVE